MKTENYVTEHGIILVHGRYYQIDAIDESEIKTKRKIIGSILKWNGNCFVTGRPGGTWYPHVDLPGFSCHEYEG